MYGSNVNAPITAQEIIANINHAATLNATGTLNAGATSNVVVIQFLPGKRGEVIYNNGTTLQDVIVNSKAFPKWSPSKAYTYSGMNIAGQPVNLSPSTPMVNIVTVTVTAQVKGNAMTFDEVLAAGPDKVLPVNKSQFQELCVLYVQRAYGDAVEARTNADQYESPTRQGTVKQITAYKSAIQKLELQLKIDSVSQTLDTDAFFQNIVFGGDTQQLEYFLSGTNAVQAKFDRQKSVLEQAIRELEATTDGTYVQLNQIATVAEAKYALIRENVLTRFPDAKEAIDTIVG